METTKRMSTSQAEYFIGIDLGTTHTVVAYTSRHKASTPQIFEIEQLISAGEVAKRSMLPSFRYHPLAGEFTESDLILPWQHKPVSGDLPELIIGHWARELGSKTAGRLVSSAKSWLSHPQIDQTAAILPWNEHAEISKVSPVVASASYLNYIRQAWNHAHPQHPLERQQIVITVPASFDEMARTLTVEAALLAGLPNIVLLEEPQAVCYDWFLRHQQQASTLLEHIALLLICDVGGGTCDFSLIQIKSNNQQLELKRIAVGEHLMLGGDNIDLALAHTSETRLSSGRLSSARLAQLVQQARKAKETLLSESAPETATITLLGSGSRLIAGSQSCQLNRAEVQDLALTGFFPQTQANELPSRRRSAMVEFGLSYASDPAITRHIAEFLAQHQAVCRTALNLNEDQLAIPDAILLNGGVFNSKLLQQQLLKVLGNWREQALTILDNPHPDEAVAYGAVAYSLARIGKLQRIQSGAARSYFLQLETKQTEPQAVCILPRDSVENEPVLLDSHRFELQLGQPVRFHLWTTRHEQNYQAGQLCTVNPEAFHALPPLLIALEQGNRQQETVQLQTQLTEVGTLQLNCIAEQQSWLVEFEIRKSLHKQHHVLYSGGTLPAQFELAAEKISLVYGAKNKDINDDSIKQLRNQLEQLLGERDNWSPTLLRALFDVLLDGVKKRRRSALHERLWFTLAGYCLRPGVGCVLDDWRILQISPLYQEGLQFPQEVASRTAWCTFWRRIAAGLNTKQQQQILQDLSGFFHANPQDIAQDYDEIIRLMATLENLPINDKLTIWNWLLKRIRKGDTSESSWWALGRIGNRQLFYGDIQQTMPKAEVEKIIPELSKLDWKKHPQIALSAVILSRKTGDRMRDISDGLQQQISKKLKSSKAPARWIEMIESISDFEQTEQNEILGDNLPVGLRLL